MRNFFLLTHNELREVINYNNLTTAHVLINPDHISYKKILLTIDDKWTIEISDLSERDVNIIINKILTQDCDINVDAIKKYTRSEENAEMLK
jgi:ethanolamine utilization microcompartment shell protein EutS